MRWLKSALFISLSLNIAFVFGYFYSDKNLNNLIKSSEKRQQFLHKRLELSKEQKVLFKNLKSNVFLLTDNYKQKDKELLTDYWLSLLLFSSKQDQKEEQKLNFLLNEMSKNSLNYRQQVTADLKILMEDLSPEQRTKIVKILQRQNLFFRLIRQKPK